MSAGVVHRKASLMLTVGFILTAILQLNPNNLLYGIGSLIGVMVTPDWDVDAGMISDAMIRNKLGVWAEKIWDAFLYWYRRSLKHGSPLSHFPVISTYGRIAYAFAILIVVPHVAYYYIFHPAWDLYFVINWYWKEINSQQQIIQGLIASDTIHFFLDLLTTEHKEKK